MTDVHDPHESAIDRLAKEAAAGRLSRHEFLFRAAALGLSVPAGVSILTGLAGSQAAYASTIEAAGERLSGRAPAHANLAALGPFKYCSRVLGVRDTLAWKLPKAKKPYKIGYMLISLQGYYFVASAYGAKSTARKTGTKVQIVAAQGFASPEIQQTQLGDLLQRGVDAIVLQPADVNASVPLARQALDKGVPLVVAGSLLNTPAVAQAVQQDYALGQQSADILAKHLGPAGGQGILMAGPASATWSSNRTKGFIHRVATAHPRIKVVATPHQNFVDPTEGLRTFDNAIQAHPNIQWIYAVDYNLLEAPSIPPKYRGKVKYVAMGYYGTSRAALRAGQIDAVIGIMPVFGAMVGMTRAIQLLNGDTVPAITCYPGPVYTRSRVNAPEAKYEVYPNGFKP